MDTRLNLKPIDTSFSLKDHIYSVLKDGITSMNVYTESAELRLDERRMSEQLGISRKVQNMKERRRLRRIARSILPEGYGCIIRTVAQDKDEEVIRQDLLKQINIWRSIEQKLKEVDGPTLLYKDQSVANTVMRDLFTPDTTRVVIDNKSLYREIHDYVEWAAPGLADKVELYSGSRPIFDEYGVEKELEKMASTSRKDKPEHKSGD